MKTTGINIIVATTTNLVIGKDNDIPWYLPTDLKYFKRITDGHTVIMGRKCWESIPEKYRPLPNRHNIVLTRNKDYVADGADIHDSLLSALRYCEGDKNDIFIIGGAQIYKEAFGWADKLYLTQIYDNVDGDIKLEGLEPSDWKLVTTGDMLEENDYKFRFEYYERKTEKILGQL